VRLPKLALKLLLSRPSAGGVAAEFVYEVNAPELGCRVTATVSQKAANDMNTTKEKVFPRKNSRSPLMINNTPPKNKYAPLYSTSVEGTKQILNECLVTYIEAAPFPPAPRQPMRSQDRGVTLRRIPKRPLSKISIVSLNYDF